jgi:TonB family protein
MQTILLVRGSSTHSQPSAPRLTREESGILPAHSALCTQRPITFGVLPENEGPVKLTEYREAEAMRSTVRIMFLATLALTTVALTVFGSAQNTPATVHAERKVASRVAPNYPDLARKMHIHGVVKVEAIVRANGSVKSTRVLGGNPVLVDAAVDAINKWKFEPEPSETTEVIQLTFESQ